MKMMKGGSLMKKIRHINIQSIIMINILLLLGMLCGDADKGGIINILIVSLFGLTILRILMAGNIKKSIIFSPIIKWNFIFFVICFMSVLWSIYQEHSFAMSFVMLKRLIIIFSIVINIRNKDDLFKVLKFYLIACMFMMIKITYFFLIKGETGSKMWDLACGNYFNTVAQLLAFAIIIAYYFLRSEKNKKYIKVAYIFFMAFSVWHIYITGSRKGIIMPITEIFIYLVIINRKSMVKMLRAMFIMLIIGGIAIYILSRNQELWNRMIIMFEMIFSGEQLDESTQLRSYFINLAGQMFANKPIIGQGVNSFVGVLNSEIGKQMYSHNNYLEIASGLGIIGLVSYYWYYVYLVKGFIKNINKDNINALGLSIIVTLAIFEYGIVTYSVLLYPILLTFLGLIVEMNKWEDNKEIYS